MNSKLRLPNLAESGQCARRIVTDSPLYEHVRQLARDSGRKAKEIAKEAGVAYQPFARFLYQGKQYNGHSLALVYFELTGKPLHRSMKPLGKKGGKAA